MTRGLWHSALAAVLLLATAATLASTQTLEDLSTDIQRFLDSAAKALKWNDPTEPVKIVGPLYFVGTEGLSAWLFTTPKGHILLNTGLPSSAPMIVESIKKLGFEAEDVEIIINGHAHIDHAGAIARMKEISGAKVAIMEPDVRAIEDGGKDDFFYGRYWKVMGFPPVEVDRVLRDGDKVELGDVVLTAHHTPGHTKGSTTWVTTLVDGGESYTVVFADGMGFNPGYNLASDPSYPGIGDDFRRTLGRLELLKPDIWAGHHTEFFDFAGKRARAKTEGVKAWIDPEGYRRFIANKRRAFEDEIDRELGVTKDTGK